MAHPSYASRPNVNDIALPVNDIALLFLMESTTLDITLPQLNNNNDFPPPGSRTHVLGWGATDDGSLPDVLLRVDLEVISNEDCNNADEDNYNGQIFDDMICTETDGQDACKGDSGEIIADFSLNND